MTTKKILVVDDEKMVCDSIKKILTRQGFETDCLIDPKDVIKHLGERSYDLVITDLMMPGISGLELIELIKKYYPELEVVVITGYASIDTAVKATKLGASDYIPKPFTPDEISEITRKALERKRMNDERRDRKQESLPEKSEYNVIDVDMPFDEIEVEKATSEAFVAAITHSDIPIHRKTDKRTEYCQKGKRECRRLVLEKKECEGECPLEKKSRERALKARKSQFYASNDVIDVDIPYSMSEAENFMSMDYIGCLDRSDIPRAALFGKNVVTKHNVLVVDDEPVVCNGLRKILKKQNCTVYEAFDVDEALLKVQLNNFDLIFLDMKMPKKSGMEVLSYIKERYPEIPVIMITGYGTIETAVEATKLGAFNFIPKPFTADELTRVAVEALS